MKHDVSLWRMTASIPDRRTGPGADHPEDQRQWWDTVTADSEVAADVPVHVPPVVAVRFMRSRRQAE
ncbi:hypothetical protein GCM10022252_04960 [Streptosporangium oxazolinicum]|uniref:Uncharacterized protein n=1 Tax=Streptosporangium oxazolinicum TaxID=909287 RepID=A0ABP8AB73_9ACTN